MRLIPLAVVVGAGVVGCSSSPTFNNIACKATVSGNTEAFPCEAHIETANGTSVVMLTATGATDSAYLVASFSRSTLVVGQTLKQDDPNANDTVEYTDAMSRIWIASGGVGAGAQGTYELSITEIGPKSGQQTPLNGGLMATLPPQGMPTGTAITVQATF